jgi:N-acyl-D-amino-acid deacylase
VLKDGYAADMVLFREKEVDEAATFAKPIQPARGIETVVVNGEVVWRGGKPTGARPGMVLARALSKPSTAQGIRGTFRPAGFQVSECTPPTAATSGF